MKRTWVLLFLYSMLSALSAQAALLLPEKEIICLWDIHDTLVARDNMTHYLMACKLGFLAFVLCREAAPMVLEANKRRAAGEHTEQLLLAKGHEFRAKAEEALTAGNVDKANGYLTTADRLHQIAEIIHAFELIFSYKEGMIELIDTLKACGITRHHIASNAGMARYQELKQKFPAILNPSMVHDGLVVDPTELPMLKKPDYLFFKKLSLMFNPNGDKQLIFIDDLKENVDAANNSNLGIIGIHMTSVQQLTTAFQKLGIAPTAAGIPAQVAAP